jgi:hypothetical protein
MIRYPVAAALLDTMVDAESATWRTRAATATAGLITAGSFDRKSNFWGEIKMAFMKAQNFKCIFCERALSQKEVGSGEHDLEHFRPKGNLKPWPRGARARQLAYTFTTGAAGPGYHWLAYDLANYTASCIPCNRALKSDSFPIAGPRGGPHAAVTALDASERPFLIYPFGDASDDPAAFITFDGVVAVPSAAAGHDLLRGRVTIDFFKLNERGELFTERFQQIESYWGNAQTYALTTDPTRKAAARRALDRLVSPVAPHSACTKAFERVMIGDPGKAWCVYQDAEAFLKSRASA